VDEKGALRMVDVSSKEPTLRTATARGEVRMKPETLEAIASGSVPKGDVISTARLAGIMAAKKTPELVPLCHPIRLDALDVHLTPRPPDRIEVEATARARDVTGVEMEALTAVAASCLTLYDMCKAIDRGMTVEGIELTEKTGGKSGPWSREPRHDR